MRSTMQRSQLTTGTIFAHGSRVYGTSQVITLTGDGYREASFAHVARRTRQLASALDQLGLRPGDRVATLCRNHQEHLEACFAVPGMGAVLHPLSLGLTPDELAWTVGHAQDRLLIVDASLAAAVAPVFPQLATVEQVLVVGDGRLGLGAAVPYEEFIAAGDEHFGWPDLDEEDAASLCYTTSGPGTPKGVICSHRSTFVHALAQCTGNTFALSERDRILPAVTMSDANGWGLPYSGWIAGCDFVLPGPYLDAGAVTRLIGEQRVTVAEGVRLLWEEVLARSDDQPADLSSLRLVVCCGASVPRSLIARYRDRFGVPLVQGWGLTETSPLAAVSSPPPGTGPDEELDYRAKNGRLIAGVEARIVDGTGRELPWDGDSVGELELRGPWVTGSYFREPTPEKFRDGWFRTGDWGTIDPLGFVRLADRVVEGTR